MVLLQALYVYSVPLRESVMNAQRSCIIVMDPVATPALDPDGIFDRIVNRHFGGFCFLQAMIFCNILLTLGFDVRPVLGTVCVGKTEHGRLKFEGEMHPTHCVNLVQIDGKEYIVDVGFGRRGPIVPVPMPASEEDIGGSASDYTSLPLETWHLRKALPDEIPSPPNDTHPFNNGFLMEHRSLKPGQAEADGSWDELYIINHSTYNVRDFERLCGNVCFGRPGTTDKFQKFLTLSRVYLQDEGIGYPAGQRDRKKGRLARVAMTNMELSEFRDGRKQVLKQYATAEERKRDLKDMFGLSV